jgi:drug/metabolite transporter (DMT)-like permease
MDFVRLPLIATIGLIFYGEPLDIYTILGATIVFAANLLNIVVEHRSRTQKSAST